MHESSSVSILDGPDVVYVARVQARRIMSVTISVGTRFRAHQTSMSLVPASRASRRRAEMRKRLVGSLLDTASAISSELALAR